MISFGERTCLTTIPLWRAVFSDLFLPSATRSCTPLYIPLFLYENILVSVLEGSENGMSLAHDLTVTGVYDRTVTGEGGGVI